MRVYPLPPPLFSSSFPSTKISSLSFLFRLTDQCVLSFSRSINCLTRFARYTAHNEWSPCMILLTWSRKGVDPSLSLQTLPMIDPSSLQSLVLHSSIAAFHNFLFHVLFPSSILSMRSWFIPVSLFSWLSSLSIPNHLNSTTFPFYSPVHTFAILPTICTITENVLLPSLFSIYRWSQLRPNDCPLQV